VTGPATTRDRMLPGSIPEDPARQLSRWRITVGTVTVAIAALPLLRPSGPGNTGLVDLALLVAILAAVLAASTRAYRIRMPYAFAAGLTVVAGAVAVTLSPAGSGEVHRGGLALVQDVFVFGWAAAITTVSHDRRLLDTVFKAFAFSTVAWAALLIVGEIAGLTWITGINSRDGIRASLTFGDPNLAADYFVCGLLVLRACQRPRHRGRRFVCCAVIVTAIIMTLSNGGMIALLIASSLGGLFALARRRGAVAAATAGLLLATVVGVAATTIDVGSWVTRVEQSDALIRDSLGRQAESSGSRSALAKEGLTLWLHDDTALGYGPSNTETTLRASGAAYVKEAHDDYLATLLERGVIGGVALVVLITGVAVRARRISVTGGLDPELRAIVPRPELLAAACIAIAMSAAFYEVLHFRHVWAVFGLVAALEQANRS
jgi:O-antigen ligase